jgi:hypothetical protein
MNWIASTQCARRQVLISAIAEVAGANQGDAAGQAIYVHAACFL